MSPKWRDPTLAICLGFTRRSIRTPSLSRLLSSRTSTKQTYKGFLYPAAVVPSLPPAPGMLPHPLLEHQTCSPTQLLGADVDHRLEPPLKHRKSQWGGPACLTVTLSAPASQSPVQDFPALEVQVKVQPPHRHCPSLQPPPPHLTPSTAEFDFILSAEDPAASLPP